MNIINRKGHFRVSSGTIDKFPEIVMMIMARCVVVRAESLVMYDCVEYDAYSPEFDTVEVGCYAPRYTAVINEDESGATSISFVRDE